MPKLYVITGPSGVGKTSVALKLVEALPRLKKLVTCTTRAMRDGEVADVDYHFFTNEEFERMIERGELFEWDKHYGYWYGNRTAELEALLDDGLDVLMVVDVNGARTIKKNRPDAFVIFLTADSSDNLEDRIRSRASITEEELTRRMQKIREEMSFASQADLVVTNTEGKLATTVHQIKIAIQTSKGRP
ncbi:MAG: guanylate kinase [Patescibacteria group bacterium]